MYYTTLSEDCKPFLGLFCRPKSLLTIDLRARGAAFNLGLQALNEKKRKWPITQHHSPEGGKQPVGRAASQLPATGLTQMSPEGAKKALTRQVVSLEKHHSSISSTDRIWSSVQ